MGSHPPFCRCLLGCGIPEFFLEAGQSSGDFPIPSTPQTGGQRLQQWRPITRLPVQLPRHCCCFEEKKQKNAIHCSTLRMQFPALIQLVSLRGVFLTFCLLTMGTEPCITLGGEVGAGLLLMGDCLPHWPSSFHAFPRRMLHSAVVMNNS